MFDTLDRSDNRAADVWALGCVLYELMTLSAPWADMKFNAAGGMSALLKKIANADLDLSPCKRRYSSELCAICCRSNGSPLEARGLAERVRSCRLPRCALLGMLLHKRGVDGLALL